MGTHTDAPWLDAMVDMIGLKEVEGKRANPAIVRMFADVGHAEVRSDEVAWCSACTGSVLKASGMPIPPTNVNLLARSYLTYGVKCDPKPGAIAIWPRGKSDWQGHVNIVERVTDDGKVVCVGGNQSNAVTRTKPLDPANALGFRWPVAPTVADLREAGSTEIKKGDRVQNVGIGVVVFGPVIAVVKEMWSWVPDVPRFGSFQEGLTFTQQILEGLNAIGRLVLDNPWLAATFGAGIALGWIGSSVKALRVRKARAGVPLSVEAANAAA